MTMNADELQRPDLTITEAAKAARVDRRTIRRRLDSDTFPNAYRQGPDGPWKIPVGDLIAAGLPLHKSQPERAPAPAPTMLFDATELDRLRDENTDLRRRAEVAEAVAAERLLRAENAELALRALTAPTTGTDVAHVVPTSPGTPPANAEQARRRWWNRR